MHGDKYNIVTSYNLMRKICSESALVVGITIEALHNYLLNCSEDYNSLQKYKESFNLKNRIQENSIYCIRVY